MTILVDTNLLTRLTDSQHPHHLAAADALARYRTSGDRLVVAAQSLYEFWVVATRPTTSAGGFGFTPVAAEAQLLAFEALFELLPESGAPVRRMAAPCDDFRGSGQARSRCATRCRHESRWYHALADLQCQ